MKNVLIVDDSPIVRRHLRGLLERDGCLVYEAADGEEGLHLLSARAFDVMFLDLHMPNVDGTALLTALEKDKKRLPIVLITSTDSSAEIVNAFKLGAQDYLLKPFREPQVRRAMQQATGLDYSTIYRTRSDVALLDRDEGLAQTVRAAIGANDNIDHAESMNAVPDCLVRSHQVILVGNLDANDEASEAEEAEAVGDIAAQRDPNAVLIRLLPNKASTLEDVTVFHGAVARDDEAGFKKLFRAIRSGAALAAGRKVRALPYDGPPELAHLYWWTVRRAVEDGLKKLVSSGASTATVDLSLAPDDQAQLDGLREWVLEFSESTTIEVKVVREAIRVPASPSAVQKAPPAALAEPVIALPTPAPAPVSVAQPAPSAADADRTRVQTGPLPAAAAPPSAENATRVQTVPVADLMEGPATRVAPPSLLASATAPEVPPAPVAAPPASPAKESPPIVIPGFEIGAMVGEGGMSRVYRATQKSLRRQVCVKIMREEFAREQSLADRFQDEGIALATLRHPNIVSVLDVGRSDDGQLFMVMEYVDGGDLRDLLKRVERVPLVETVNIISQLLGGLAEAHGNGIIHRDLKPSNVLLARLKDGSNLVKLVDFGIAKIIEGMGGPRGGTRVGTVVGTPGYMAPEQLLGMDVSSATDLYAVGVILFELLTGRRPFVARDEFELAQLTMMTPVPHLHELLTADVPTELDALLGSLLAKNPRHRPQTAAEVAARLRAIRLPVAA